MASADELQKYLQRVTGMLPEMVPVPAHEIQKLPIFLTDAWDLLESKRVVYEGSKLSA